MKKYIYLVFLLLLSNMTKSQSVLKADGEGNTYELINSVLAPNYDAIETPDCAHSEFGRHIDEVYDSTLGKHVFRFHMHVHPDNDRCINFDRQRNEIKTYGPSPDSLLGTEGETVVYRWKFKLDPAFQPSSSFTHLHQIKAVGGSEAAMPIMTFTLRKANPDRFELRYAESFSQITLGTADLALFKGNWIGAKETITYGEIPTGKYEVLLTDIASLDTVFHYINSSIRVWKTNASFVRPKWGIYRSLNDSINLRDERVFFADFSIEEEQSAVTSIQSESDKLTIRSYPNPSPSNIMLDLGSFQGELKINLFNIAGKLIKSDVMLVSQHVQYTLPKNSGLYLIMLQIENREPIFVKVLKIKN